MATGHAIMGATVWLTGCAAVELLGHQQLGAAVQVVGTAVCAGWALAPDLDHPKSTVSKSLGPVSRIISKGIAKLGAVVHEHTRTIWDRPDEDGHRTLTHTVVWAVLCGIFAVGAGRAGGPWAAGILVFAATSLAVKASLPWEWRRHRVKVSSRPARWVTVRVEPLAATAFAVVAYVTTPPDAWWLGLAVGIGCFAHCLGDAMTKSGCPFLWPLPIGRRGRRRTWYLIGMPGFLRFRVNGTAEKVVTFLFVLVSSGAVYLLVWGY